jgi:hypothetical protein
LIYEAEAGTNPSGVVGTTLLVARDGAVPKLRPSFGLRGADRVASAGEDKTAVSLQTARERDRRGDDHGIGHYQKPAAGHPRERFDRAFNIADIFELD